MMASASCQCVKYWRTWSTCDMCIYIFLNMIIMCWIYSVYVCDRMLCTVHVHTCDSCMKSVESWYMLMESPIKWLSARGTERERERKSQWHTVAHLFIFVNDINAVERLAKECAILSMVFLYVCSCLFIRTVTWFNEYGSEHSPILIALFEMIWHFIPTNGVKEKAENTRSGASISLNKLSCTSNFCVGIRNVWTLLASASYTHQQSSTHDSFLGVTMTRFQCVWRNFGTLLILSQ